MVLFLVNDVNHIHVDKQYTETSEQTKNRHNMCALCLNSQQAFVDHLRLSQ